MGTRQTSLIKKSQKESLLYREISRLLMNITLEDKELQGIFANRAQLSDDKGVCTIFFYVTGGKEEFDKKLPHLILYKPSLRKAISKLVPGRYTPELIFKYDTSFEKQQKIENLFDKIDKIKDEEPS